MKRGLFFLICLFAIGAFANSDVTPAQIRAALPETLRHPYLYFSEADKPDILSRIKTNPECGRIYHELLEKADLVLELGEVRKPDLEALAFVYQMTGDARYAQKAFGLIRDYPFGKETFDLNSSRACRALAMLYDWLYSGLTDLQRETLRGQLLNQLSDIRWKYTQTWWVHATRCNWNPVCHSAAGVAALALYPEDPSLVDVMAEAYNGIYKTYNEIGRDGDWCEGVGYWSYGLFVSLLYADALERASGGQFCLLQHEKIQANPVSFGLHTLVPAGPFLNAPQGSDWKSVNFEDSGDNREDAAYRYNRIAAATGSGEAVWLKRTIFGNQGGSAFDIIWPEPKIEPSLPAQASKHFRDFGWAIMRSDFTNPENVMLAAVCAEHWDPTREIYISRFQGAEPIPASEKPWGIELDTYFMSHGHLHAGTFNLYWRGEGYISEMGKVGYPTDYWTPARWSYPFANSLGHNTVQVNGERQNSGKGIGGTILEFRSSGSRDYTLMDASMAYPGKSLKCWRRHLVLDKPDVTVVLDEIDAVPGGAIAVRFHSDCEVEPHDKFLLIQGRAGLMALIPVAQFPLELKTGEHDLSNVTVPSGRTLRPSGNAAKYMDVSWRAGEEQSLLATVILPVQSAAQARAVAASARLERNANGVTLTFEKDGESRCFEWNAAEDGLRLK